ncbi:imidazolonepropionase-like amidohydrolase [Actinocorallia herbida]|uniref:Imidazolonepropionase-like amidohydrolase n=1 Tax=Actinocorallia herbida TaxID=58109 RepID=A0A3N1D6D6_9ACTN|nr:amidohydrolase family protein [Actinocorallia herbida]ROO89097.1 imidazolonepropionase-like amidohydrolase [Actinocorallia herbida]
MLEFPGAPTPYAPAPEDAVTVYRGATLIDGHGGPSRPGTSIAVLGQVLAFVGPDAELPAAFADAETVELTGRFVVPGLIDTHQHLATPPDRTVAEFALRRQVYGGVTAIRDMADDLRQISDLARATLVGEIPGPDLGYAALTAGPGFFSDPRTWEVSRGAAPGAIPHMQAITDATDLPLAVALARGTGAVALKIYADLPARLVAELTAEAHRQGLHVWAHAAVFPATPRDIVEAGVDVVSHATLLAHEASAQNGRASYAEKPPIDFARFTGEDDPVMAGLFALMRERGTILDATAALYSVLAEPGEDDPGFPHGPETAELAVHLTRQAHAAGVEICAGTDYETDADTPYPSLIEEIEFLVARCGFTAAQAIRSATLVGAKAMDAEDVRGTVEPGKLADLVVLAEDPYADIAALRTVVGTLKRGTWFDRADFSPAAKGTDR